MYKNKLHDQDNHDDVITHLDPDILECEVKWALESITMNKASGGDGIPGELFQILTSTHMYSKCWTCLQTQFKLVISVILSIKFVAPKRNYLFRLVGSGEAACK